MHATTYLLLFTAIFAGVLAIAATLGIEFYRDRRRHRLVTNVRTALAGTRVESPEEAPLKRAA
jgi:hypothetical protein